MPETFRTQREKGGDLTPLLLIFDARFAQSSDLPVRKTLVACFSSVYVPVPLSEDVCGLFDAPSVTVNVPVNEPAAVG